MGISYRWFIHLPWSIAKVQYLSKYLRLQQLSVGTRHCLALDPNGTLYGWGYNRNGELLIKE